MVEAGPADYPRDRRGWLLAPDGAYWWDGVRWRPFKHLTWRSRGILGALVAVAVAAPLFGYRADSESQAGGFVVGLLVSFLLTWWGYRIIHPVMVNHPPRDLAADAMPSDQAQALMRDLTEGLHFKADELAWNRRGSLAPAQFRRLVLKELRILIGVGMLVGAAGLGIWLLAAPPNGHRDLREGRAVLLVVCSLGGAAWLLRNSALTALDMLGGKVETSSGTLTLATERSSWDGLLQLGGGKGIPLVPDSFYDLPVYQSPWGPSFRLRKASVRLGLLPKDLACTAYYTPRTQRLVAVMPSEESLKRLELLPVHGRLTTGNGDRQTVRTPAPSGPVELLLDLNLDGGGNPTAQGGPEIAATRPTE